MAEVLGVKREQIDGVRNPDADLIEQLQSSEDHVKRLARELLQRRGLQIPDVPESTHVRHDEAIEACA
jgi:hypothetical protein